MARRIDTQAVIEAVRFEQQGSDVATPAAGYWIIYFKSDGVYIRDDAGNITGPINTLDGLGDVGDLSTANDGDVLTYDDGSSTWIAAAGGGSGDLTDVPLAVFIPPGEPPASNYATFDTRNQHPVLDFDDSTDESIVFTGILGAHYAGGGVTVYLYLTDTNDTNSAHKSYWDVSFERMIGLDIDSDSFAAAQSGNISPNGTSGIPVVLSIAFTDGAQMDSVAAGEIFRLKVTRDADNGSDDWSGDAELLAVKIMET